MKKSENGHVYLSHRTRMYIFHPDVDPDVDLDITCLQCQLLSLVSFSSLHLYDSNEMCVTFVKLTSLKIPFSFRFFEIASLLVCLSSLNNGLIRVLRLCLHHHHLEPH